MCVADETSQMDDVSQPSTGHFTQTSVERTTYSTHETNRVPAATATPDVQGKCGYLQDLQGLLISILPCRLHCMTALTHWGLSIHIQSTLPPAIDET